MNQVPQVARDSTSAALAVATVRLDSPLPHLDRSFDYLVPERLADTVTVGSRVRVPFAGRLVHAVVVAMSASSQFEGKLSEIRSAGATPSFTPAGIELAERVSRRYGGSMWDVLRLMAPPRVASVEKRDWTSLPGNPAVGSEQSALTESPAVSTLPDRYAAAQAAQV